MSRNYSMNTLLILVAFIQLFHCHAENKKTNATKKEQIEGLKKYFVLRGKCPFELNHYYQNETNETNPSNVAVYIKQKYCPTAADPLHCFPTTPRNQTIYFKCPYNQQYNSSEQTASRHCSMEGKWNSTNYERCKENLVMVTHPDCSMVNKTGLNNSREMQLKCNPVNEWITEKLLYNVMINFYLIGFSVTILSVSFAIFIFLSIRSLRCLRNMIHCNMLFTFVLKCATFICFYIFVLNNASVWEQDNVLCIIFNVVWNYSMLASFFWMMIEAVYLITVIVAAYSSNKIKLWWYLLIGWVLPMVPIIPYAILTNSSTNTTCSWVKAEYSSPHEMIIDIPIYIVLTINFILLIVILYVIIKKLRSHNDALKAKYIQYKKLTRATIVLFPLFGLTFAVFFWHPTNTKTVFFKCYYFFNIFLQTTQGIWVSFVYCFLNDEVKNAIKTKFRSWKISHVGTSLYALSTLARSNTANNNNANNQSTTFSTQTTNYAAGTRQRTESNNLCNDTARLPMLQEDKI